ncbi:MAG TPA: patatin-like phospholipase family protein [Blastocatellia bacterium]|nr:patatin-like phospholipase family protein [Blastocatellia bacterium]
MAKVALVLSGGGAKGAFQFMAEKYAREVKGYNWEVIAGVSVGALNGVMLAQKKYQRLEEIWKTISNDQVYTGGLNVWSAIRVAFGAKSFYGNRPLRELINRDVEPNKVTVDLRIGVVSLRTGEYATYNAAHPDFKRLVLASTVMPIVWTPEDISPALQDMIDGGLRNTSPLGDVLDAEPDEVLVINCNPSKAPRMPEPPRNILDIGRGSLEIALNEILVNDIREFARINELVRQADEFNRANNLTDDKRFVPRKTDGTPFRFYKLTLIEPDEMLDDTLDFSRSAIQRSMERGWEKAKAVLG